MAMFDYFRSSFDLGPFFTDRVCQTWHLDQSGMGGSMSYFWLSPAGHLYLISYPGTHKHMEIEKSDPEYKESMKFLNYRWVPTGAHGRVEPYKITAYVEIWPDTWDQSSGMLPEMQLHFKYGRLVEFQSLTGAYSDTFEEIFLAK